MISPDVLADLWEELHSQVLEGLDLRDLVGHWDEDKVRAVMSWLEVHWADDPSNFVLNLTRLEEQLKQEWAQVSN